ncbi:MAG: hypothetical protein A2V77_00625 [Anaeromyxobacter sp. RBG_16_69_14]|nr:MAG: hypothetical protein A2V77_00625 [Anaeromyxobacter sp. RBG_16_69_14]
MKKPAIKVQRRIRIASTTTHAPPEPAARLAKYGPTVKDRGLPRPRSLEGEEGPERSGVPRATRHAHDRRAIERRLER